MDSISGMAVFARVVETNGFTSAARDLGLSKASVSKLVARLEDRLGVRLLNRSTRRLGLTEAGRDYYERARRILAEVEEAEQSAASRQANPRGQLRVNAPVTFGQTHLAPLLPRFMLLYPQVQVDLVLNDRFVDLIEEGFDLAVRVADLPSSSLIVRRLCDAPQVAVAAPRYLKARGTPKHPKDLARHDCLLYSYLATGEEWRFVENGKPFGVRVSGPLRANNGDVLRHAAIAGMGIVYTPDFIVADAIASGALVPLLEGWCAKDAGIYAVYSPGRPLGAKLRVFVDFLAETLGRGAAAALKSAR